MSRTGKSTDTESRFEAAWGWEEGGRGGRYRVFFQDEVSVPERDRSDGHTPAVKELNATVSCTLNWLLFCYVTLTSIKKGN